MNIKVQLCGIVLLLIGFLLYYPKKKLQTSSKRAFVWFYFITLCCVILDVVSIVVIENAAYLPVVFVNGLRLYVGFWRLLSVYVLWHCLWIFSLILRLMLYIHMDRRR